MLRCRPIHFTSQPEPWIAIFEALGMVRTTPETREDDSWANSGWLEFDAGAGRLALHHADEGSSEDGTTKLAFEVRDLTEFARRTGVAIQESKLKAAVEIQTQGHGDSAHVTGPDGVLLQFDTASELEQTPGANPALLVNQLWYSPDVEGGAATLRAIGAKPLTESNTGGFADFVAKNGGLIMVHHSDQTRSGGLGFSYSGPLETPLQQLTDAGIDAHIIDEAYGRTLHVSNPEYSRFPHCTAGPTIWINENFNQDHYGYTVHGS